MEFKLRRSFLRAFIFYATVFMITSPKTMRSKRKAAKSNYPAEINTENLSLESTTSYTPRYIFHHPVAHKISEVAFCSDSMSSILVLTESGIVYHSQNFGQTWRELKEHFNNHHSRLAMRIISFIQSPADKSHIIFKAYDDESLISRDCGETYAKISAGTPIKDLLFHPFEKNLILGIDADSSLVMTKDGAKTWSKIADDISEFNFAKYSDSSYFASKDRIIAIAETKDPKGSPQKNLVFSDDFFKNSKTIYENTEYFHITGCCVFIKTTNGETKVTDAFGLFYRFYDIDVEAMNHQDTKNFHIIENTLFYNVYGTLAYEAKGYELQKLLKSDYWGTHFKIQLDNLVCSHKLGDCDFEPIRSLNGIILANKYSQEYIDGIVEIPKSRYRDYSTTVSIDNIDNYKETMISFNYADRFEKIQAPRYDNKDRELKCEADICYLNLHLRSSSDKYSLPKSSPHVPGLVIATGSVGPFLENDNVGVFITEDAGLNWRMVERGNYVYELLDRGNILVMANRNTPTKHILYSLDFGRKWREIQISESELLITDITAMGGHHLKKFLIVSKASPMIDSEARIITVDMSNITTQVCKHDKDNEELSDYEEWVPHTTAENGCLDGRKVVLIRKKPDRECYNADNFTMYYVKEYCECTEDDYHCDFGYDNIDGKCVESVRTGEASLNAQPAICHDYYYVSDGYRKNYENFCVGGVTHDKVQVKCQGGMLSKLTSFAWLLLKISVLTALCVYLWQVGLQHRFIYAYESIYERILGWRNKKRDPQSSQNGFQTLSSEQKDINSLFDEDNEDQNKNA